MNVTAKVWDVATVSRRLGADHLAHILRDPDPNGDAERRMWGAWTANNLELAAAYDFLSRNLAAFKR